MGEIDEDRTDQFLSLAEVRRDLESYWTLTDLPLATGGPARYVRVAETGGRLGFITPLESQFLARAATGCASPALACCTPASDARMRRICAPWCAPELARAA